MASSERPPCGVKFRLKGPLVQCGFERAPGKRTCYWHWLAKQPSTVQATEAANRREAQLGPDGAVYQARVPQDRWPAGMRWCAGCQSFVPLFYCSGSRCKACASTAAHQAMVSRVYGLEDGEYDALFELQGGRCYICGRRSTARRLAVDHDHHTGEVRGLLCPDPDRGCNHKVIGLLDANSVDGGLAAAKRIVAYYEDSPYRKMRRAAGKTYGAARRAERLANDTPAPF